MWIDSFVPGTSSTPGAVAVRSAWSRSDVGEVTVAVFVTLPDTASGATVTWSVNVAVAPGIIWDALQVIVPFVDTSGVVQKKSVPSVVVTTRETNRSCGGRTSVIETA